MAFWRPKGTSEELQGYQEMQRKLSNLVRNIPTEEAQALYAEAQIERTESMRRTPVDEGNLRASHVVQAPIQTPQDVSVTIAVGGPAAPYAVHVHENLEANHPSGQAKFLESTLKESAPYMGQRVARRIELKRAAEGA